MQKSEEKKNQASTIHQTEFISKQKRKEML